MFNSWLLDWLFIIHLFCFDAWSSLIYVHELYWFQQNQYRLAHGNKQYNVIYLIKISLFMNLLYGGLCDLMHADMFEI